MLPPFLDAPVYTRGSITDLNFSWTDITYLSMLNTTVKLMALNISRCNLENISFLYTQQFSELNIAHSSVKESDLVGVAVEKLVINKYPDYFNESR